jgi:hypothetical protein
MPDIDQCLWYFDGSSSENMTTFAFVMWICGYFLSSPTIVGLILYHEGQIESDHHDILGSTCEIETKDS